MTAREKLAEIRFFLTKLRSVLTMNSEWSQPPDDFKYYVSACVWALYGADQHLLYDYAQTFWPTVSVEDYLDTRVFRLLATS